MPFPTNMFALLSVSAGPRCPGSDAWVHARTSVHVDASAPCRRVRDEMLSRVRAQRDGRWSDPHNNGTYTLLDDSDPGTLLLQRLTGDRRYTDKMLFTFGQSSGGLCRVDGCSESQVTSVLDASTNYCNLRMLYCGKAEGCTPVRANYKIQETAVDTSSGAGSDAGACFGRRLSANQ